VVGGPWVSNSTGDTKDLFKTKKIERIKHDTFKPTVAGLLIVDKAQMKQNMGLAEEKYWL
jgi:hypothetical protein